jgi:hypothetical protein
LDVNFAQIMHVRTGKVTEAWKLYSNVYAHDELRA